jgi:hypothetical protein
VLGWGRMADVGRRYVFDSRWRVPGSATAAYDVLVDLERYSEWWPEIRAVAKLGEDDALLVCRSRLPMTFYVEVRPVVRDREGGVLEASLDGGLVGFGRFTLDQAGPCTDVAFHQEVTTPGRTLAVAGLVARPVLVWNHQAMVRSGGEGLAVRLASGC